MWWSIQKRFDCLKREIAEIQSLTTLDRIRQDIGEGYARQLDRMSDAEAVEHLRSVDESRVLGAYIILKERLDRPTLAGICLDYLSRPGHDYRLTGALEIGSCLKQTANREVCRTLAHIVRNAQEASDIRLAAYTSLELIDWGKTWSLFGTLFVLCLAVPQKAPIPRANWSTLIGVLWIPFFNSQVVNSRIGQNRKTTFASR